MARYNILNKELYKAEVGEAMQFVQSILKSLEKYCGRPDSQLLQDYQATLHDDVAILCAITPELQLLSEMKQRCLEMLGSVLLGTATPDKAKPCFVKMLKRLEEKAGKLEAGNTEQKMWSQERGLHEAAKRLQ